MPEKLGIPGLAGGMAWTRCAAACLQFVPLLYVSRLRLLWLVLAVAAGSAAEAWWLLRRVQARRTLRDPVLVGADVACCLGLVTAARMAGPAALDSALCFSFVTAGIVGLGLGRSWRGVLAFAALAAAWTVIALPPGGPPLESDLLGLGLCYALPLSVARELKDSAHKDGAPADSKAVHELDLARDHELAFHEIHGRLLPIVDAVASGAAMSGPWMALAAKEAARARRLIAGGRARPGPGFTELLSDIRDTFTEAGMAVTAVFRITADPPGEVREAVGYAVREALTNVLKHADPRCEVHLFAESTGQHLEVVVRDRGGGFEPGGAAPGCGFARTYGAVRCLGGTVDVRSSPRDGTRVRIMWPLAGEELAG